MAPEAYKRREETGQREQQEFRQLELVLTALVKNPPSGHGELTVKDFNWAAAYAKTSSRMQELADKNPRLRERFDKLLDFDLHARAGEAAVLVIEGYTPREFRRTWDDVVASVQVREDCEQIKVSSVLGETFVPPDVSAERGFGSKEAYTPSPETLQARQSREREYLETRTDQLPKALDAVVDKVYDAIYVREVEAISLASGDNAGVVMNNAMVEAAVRKLTLYFAVEDFLAGKDGSREQLERILRQNGVKVSVAELEEKTRTPRVTITLPPVELPATEKEKQQAIEQLRRVIEGTGATRAEAGTAMAQASAEDEFAGFASGAEAVATTLGDRAIDNRVEQLTSRERTRFNQQFADSLDSEASKVESSDPGRAGELRGFAQRFRQDVNGANLAQNLKELNRYDHLLLTRITERIGWTDLHKDLQAIDKKVGEFSANDVDEIKKLLEQVRESGKQGSELALEKLLEKFGVELDAGKAGGIPEEVEEAEEKREVKGKKK